MRRTGASVFMGAETSVQGRMRKSCLTEIQRVCDVAEIKEEKVQRNSSQEYQILQRGKNTRSYGGKSPLDLAIRK